MCLCYLSIRVPVLLWHLLFFFIRLAKFWNVCRRASHSGGSATTRLMPIRQPPSRLETRRTSPHTAVRYVCLTFLAAWGQGKPMAPLPIRRLSRTFSPFVGRPEAALRTGCGVGPPSLTATTRLVLIQIALPWLKMVTDLSLMTTVAESVL